MLYRSTPALTWADAEMRLATDDPNTISTTLVGLALNDPDWSRVEQCCLSFSTHPHPQVRDVAAICFGHLARIHGRLHLELVLPVLHTLRNDPAPDVSGVAEDALDDIEMFIGSNGQEQ